MDRWDGIASSVRVVDRHRLDRHDAATDRIDLDPRETDPFCCLSVRRLTTGKFPPPPRPAEHGGIAAYLTQLMTSWSNNQLVKLLSRISRG